MSTVYSEIDLFTHYTFGNSKGALGHRNHQPVGELVRTQKPNRCVASRSRINKQTNNFIQIYLRSILVCFLLQSESLWRYQGEHVNQRLLTPLHGFPIRKYFKDAPKSIDTALTYPNGSVVFIRSKESLVYNWLHEFKNVAKNSDKE